MKRLSTFLLCFTIVFGAIAEEKKQVEQEATELTQLTLAQNHCNDIAKRITEPFEIISAYNTHYTVEELAQATDINLKQEILLYMWGRPDIANFTFLVPQYAAVMRRPQFIKFNSIMLILLFEESGFEQKGFPFHGNCVAQKRDDGRVILPLAFGEKFIKLEYKINVEPEVAFIEDLLVNGQSLRDKYRNDLTTEMQSQGVDAAISDLCKQSEFPNLKC